MLADQVKLISVLVKELHRCIQLQLIIKGVIQSTAHLIFPVKVN